MNVLLNYLFVIVQSMATIKAIVYFIDNFLLGIRLTRPTEQDKSFLSQDQKKEGWFVCKRGGGVGVLVDHFYKKFNQTVFCSFYDFIKFK